MSLAMSIVALEAGICKTPVLLTDKCGFGDVCLLDSRLEVSATVKAIEDGLVSVLSDYSILDRVVPIWFGFVKNNYEWNVIVNLYINLYANIQKKIRM